MYIPHSYVSVTYVCIHLPCALIPSQGLPRPTSVYDYSSSACIPLTTPIPGAIPLRCTMSMYALTPGREYISLPPWPTLAHPFLTCIRLSRL